MPQSSSSKKAIEIKNNAKQKFQQEEEPKIIEYPREPYKVYKDFIWKDVIKHEKNLSKIWNSNWKDLIPVASHSVKTTPIKTHENYNDIFTPKKNKTEIVSSSRIRFVQEQYGFYRELKYSKEQKKTKEKEILPCSKIRHVVKPLLC